MHTYFLKYIFRKLINWELKSNFKLYSVVYSSFVFLYFGITGCVCLNINMYDEVWWRRCHVVKYTFLLYSCGVIGTFSIVFYAVYYWLSLRISDKHHVQLDNSLLVSRFSCLLWARHLTYNALHENDADICLWVQRKHNTHMRMVKRPIRCYSV